MKLGPSMCIDDPPCADSTSRFPRALEATATYDHALISIVSGDADQHARWRLHAPLKRRSRSLEHRRAARIESLVKREKLDTRGDNASARYTWRQRVSATPRPSRAPRGDTAR